MEYSIVLEEHAGQKMVHTYIKGLLSLEARNQIGAETVQMLIDNDITKCIWDLREATLGYSLTEIHQSILNARRDFQGRENSHVALIYQHNRLEFEHARTAAYNRGIPNVDFFTNLEDGIHWLATRRE
jgi:hypothetical protein